MPIAPTQETRRVPPLGAFLEGWRRVLSAPALVLGISAAVWVTAVLLDAVAGRPGILPPATRPIWLGPGSWGPALRLFHEQLEYMSRLLAPEFARILHPDGLPFSWIAAQTIKAALWLFLTGGALDRFARGRPIRTAAFFAACGVYFFRFLRLALIVGVPAWAVLWVQRLFPGVPSIQTSVVTVVAMVALVVDFAKVRAVVEDRHSMFGAVAAAIRFIRRRMWRVLALAFLNALAMLIVLRIQFQLALTPAPGWLAVVMFAAVVLLGVSARLACLASESVFFQGELAHAGYTAAPVPVWPDSPAVEAIDNLAFSASDHLPHRRRDRPR